MNTIECAEVIERKAIAVSSGKPTTTPSATTASEARAAASSG
jgi:Mrp family chromosome partitioning ATPase